MTGPHDTPEPQITQVATDLESLWDAFDPRLAVDPESEFYAERSDDELGRLSFELQRLEEDAPFSGFLCGHGGSGKTTELRRLRQREEITERFLPCLMSVEVFGKETVHLTHDALLLEIGLQLARLGTEHGLSGSYEKELHEWGRTVVKTFLRAQGAKALAGAEAGAWIAFFKAQLSSRREWTTEQKELLEPRIQELVDILNRIAQELRNESGRRVLVIVDDLEKGDSGAHRDMHLRLFRDHYETLIQPRIATVYTLPVYFRALEDNRIPQDEIYAFSAARLYAADNKTREPPPLDREHAGYKLMRAFVERRVADVDTLVEGDSLEELMLVGGGLFRETARAIRLAAQRAILQGADHIAAEHVESAASQVLKDYQPIVRGEAVRILEAVLTSESGWVPGVEPYLQWRAVVQYENGELWLDVRSVLKPYLRNLDAGDD